MSPNLVVYIRLPSERGGFTDPPRIDWSEAKERKLWSIISKSKNDVDWAGLAEEFSVPVNFLQHQAFWLYEHELEQLKSEIQRGTLSADTITVEGSSKTTIPLQGPVEESDTTKNPTVSLENSGVSGELSLFKNPNKSLGHMQNLGIASGERNDPLMQSARSSDSSNSSFAEFSQGRTLLQGSRILQREIPQIFDSDDEDEKTNFIAAAQLPNFSSARTQEITESSTLNLSSTSISKSALEEALLDNAHF